MDPESAEYSVASLDNLNPDCLPVIFQYLSLPELLRLRYQCRSLNNAVCEHLRTSSRKLAVFLTADRSIEELEKIHNTLNERLRGCREPTPFDINQVVGPRIDVSLLANQSHFRFEEFISVNSTGSSIEAKISSLELFLTAHMSHVTKFAVVINYENYFRSVSRLLRATPALKVLLIDLTYFLPDDYSAYPAADITDAIFGLSSLDSLYYFPSDSCKRVLHLDKHASWVKEGYRNAHLLSNGDNFLEVMLPRLSVAHIHYLTFPDGETFDKIQEMSLTNNQQRSANKNHFVAVEKLIVKFEFFYFYPGTELSRTFDNVKILVLNEIFLVDGNLVTALNSLPSLIELHCRSIIYVPGPIPKATNRTVTHLYTEMQPFFGFLGWKDPPVNLTAEEMDKYAEMCKEYFESLRMLKIEQPELVVEFPPEVVEY